MHSNIMTHRFMDVTFKRIGYAIEKGPAVQRTIIHQTSTPINEDNIQRITSLPTVALDKTLRLPVPFLNQIPSVSMEVPWRRLDGKVVMVTGASSGIGRELCLDLARAGCRVVAAARRTDRLRTLCEEINGSGQEGGPVVRAVAVELDVSGVGSEIEAAVLRAWEAFGRIDALVNNAGYRGGVHSATELPEEEWHKTISTNLRGLWLVSKYVCRHMRDTKQKGSVINISSISGLERGQVHGALAYAASKRGVHGVTRVMAIELGPDNIRVNAIAPGLFKSEITAGLVEKEWLGRVVTRTYPLRTYGTTDPALTSLIRYLIHDSSEYVSGNIFIVDAGSTLPGLPIFSSL